MILKSTVYYIIFAQYTYAMVTCEIKLFWNNFEIISKLSQCFISHVTTSETEIKLFQPLKLFQNYFSDFKHVKKYSWAAISFQNNFEIISGKFPRTEIKLFQSDVDDQAEIILFHM